MWDVAEAGLGRTTSIHGGNSGPQPQSDPPAHAAYTQCWLVSPPRWVVNVDCLHVFGGFERTPTQTDANINIYTLS